jgi:hypothetical protein
VGFYAEVHAFGQARATEVENWRYPLKERGRYAWLELEFQPASGAGSGHQGLRKSARILFLDRIEVLTLETCNSVTGESLVLMAT